MFKVWFVGVSLQTRFFSLSMLTVRNPLFGRVDEDNDTDSTIVKIKNIDLVNAKHLIIYMFDGMLLWYATYHKVD